jgi:hypothetical protein
MPNDIADAQIKHMVDRFLGWKLPENFNPDGGISFQATFNEMTVPPRRREPVGTNLLDAAQAEAMVRHMIEGMPTDQNNAPATTVIPGIEALEQAAKLAVQSLTPMEGVASDRSDIVMKRAKRLALFLAGSLDA